VLPTLIFIPDISGLTTFIKGFEISHSTHIISELLESESPYIKPQEVNEKIPKLDYDA
jgi:hypothetical protein